MAKIKNILFISYYFPPAGGIRVLRNYSFVKYLSNLTNYHIFVITTNFPKDGMEDYFLYKTLKNKRIKIYPLISFNFEYYIKKIKKAIFKNSGKKNEYNPPKENIIIKKIINTFFIPDHNVIFFILNFFKFFFLLKKIKPDVVISSSPPFSCHLIALLLKNIFNYKWIVDLRDPWLGHKPFVEPYGFIKKINSFIEYIVFKKCDKIITCVQDFIENYKKTYQIIPEKKYHLILNGYDDDLFETAQNKIKKNNNFFTINYSGSFNVWRSPQLFINSLKTFEEKYLSKINKKIQFTIWGNYPEKYTQLPEKYEIKKIEIKFNKHINYFESIKKMLETDVNLLIVSDREGPNVPTGKFSNYLAAKKPILALLPKNSIITKFINDNKIGIALEESSAEIIAESIMNLINNYETYETNFKKIELQKYSRKLQTKELLKILDSFYK
ncbi:MAG TPA: glycosyltransferase [bacterium]|nr:glycosyltransferase [bacterium]HOL46637.1 glycosyltransferase [bacterium]HPQ17791.1 glycosyltransferase [bacterium]